MEHSILLNFLLIVLLSIDHINFDQIQFNFYFVDATIILIIHIL